VAAGVLKLHYPIFALSVAVSSAAWAGIFLLLGVLFGTRLEHSIRASPAWFIAGAVLVVAAAIGIFVFRSRQIEGAKHSGTLPTSEASQP
jgi:membrane protein DedA with SNARE-associated domain